MPALAENPAYGYVTPAAAALAASETHAFGFTLGSSYASLNGWLR